ncbi:MAG: response regulator [bacterium]
MAAKTNQVYHICLAGRLVSSDWLLIQGLKAQHQVTLIEQINVLSQNLVLAQVNVLVLDVSANQRLGLRLLSFIKRRFPKLCIVLVDGGLTQQQVIAAFKKGAQDYFANPYDVRLLVERVQALSASATP